MTNLFDIAVRYDDEKKEYVGIVHSVTDDRVLLVRSGKLRKCLSELAKMVRAKTAEILQRPPEPEPSRIIQLNGHGPVIVQS